MFKLFFGFHKRPQPNGFQPQSKRYQGPAMRLEEMRTPSGIVLDDTETTDDSGSVANSDLDFEDFEFPSQESDMAEELPGEELDPESLDVAEDGNTETNLAEEDLENLPYFYGDIDDEPSSESDGDLVTDIAESTDAEPQESSSDETAEIASDSTDSSNSTDPEFEELDWIEADGASDKSMGDESELNPDDEVNTETVEEAVEEEVLTAAPQAIEPEVEEPDILGPLSETDTQQNPTEEAIETNGLSEKSMGDESELNPDDEVNTETVEEAVEEKVLTGATKAIKPKVDQPDIVAQLSETDTPEDTTNPEIETLTPESDYIITDEIEAEDSSLGAEPDEGGESESYSSFAKLSDSDAAGTGEGVEPQVDNSGGDSENEPLVNEETETHSDDEGVEPQGNTTVGNSENEPLVTEEGETNSNDEPEDSATSEAEETPDDNEAKESGLVADAKFTNLKPKFESGTFKVGETGQVEVDFIFDGGAYKGQVAIVSLSGMEGLDPTSREFFLESISRAASNSELGYMVIDDNIEGARFEGRLGEGNYNSGEYQGVKSFLMRPGDEFFLMLVPNGTVQQVLNNPNAGGALRPLFSLATANPNDGYHFGQIADITGDGSAFAWEDIRIDGNSDRDYNDIVLQFRGATGKAALMDNVVAAGKDWRGSDLGQAVMEYVKTYITPEPANLDAALEDLLADLESLFNEADSFDEDLNLGADLELEEETSLADEVTETDVEFEAIASEGETEVANEVEETTLEEEAITAEGETETDVEFGAIAAEDETSVTDDAEETDVEEELIAAETETEVVDDAEETDVEFEAIAAEDETELADEVTETDVEFEEIAAEGEISVTDDAEETDVEEELIAAETEPEVTQTDVEEEAIAAEGDTDVANEVAETTLEEEAIAAESETEVADEVVQTPVEEEAIAAEGETSVTDDVEETDAEEEVAAVDENSSQMPVEAEETQETQETASSSAAGDTEPSSQTRPIETQEIIPTPAMATPDLSPNDLAKTELISRLDNLTQTLTIQANNSQTSSVSVNPALIERLETLTQTLQTQNSSRSISESTFALVSRLEEMVWQSSPALPVPAPSFSFATANQPLVGVIDTGFSGNNSDIDYSRITWGRDHIDGDNDPTIADGEGNEHGTHILGIIAAQRDNDIGIDGINPNAPIWAGRAVGSGKWAESLVEFVDAARESGQPNAVVNLSLDLTQTNSDGSVTTRYEFTPQERAAIEYARQHNVMLVVAAGNDGGVMSALGQSSQEFDNIITVGASERLNDEIALSKAYNRTEYSSYGYGLDIVAPGGTIDNPHLSLTGEGVGAMAGTSVATAKVTGAISQVWAANPSLSYRQVIEIIKNTATDLGATGFDLETGAGLLNMVAAVQLAKVTSGEWYDVLPTLIPDTWSGEGKVTPGERAVGIFDQLPSGGTTAIGADELQRLNQIKSIIVSVANSFNIHPAIVAAIISRETNTRNIIGDGGRGHGYMQLDIGTFPNIKNQPWSDPVWNIQQGVNLLINDKYAYLKSRLPASLHLRGSLAAYNSGQGKVVTAYQKGLDVDAYTTGRNYSADVLNRAHWLAQNGWGSNNNTTPGNNNQTIGSIPQPWQMSSSAKGVGQVAVGRNQDGRLEAFVIGPDNKVYQSWQTTPNGGWSNWKQLSGGIAKSLTVSRNQDGRLEVFAIGTDNKVYQAWQTTPNGGWSNWQQLSGGITAQDLTVGQNADGRLEVFAIGTDNKVYQAWQTTPNGGWSNWQQLSGGIAKTITVGRNQDGRLEVFAIGTDNKVYQAWQTTPNGGWSNWQQLSG
ncbi:S8 family serine peptidase, partial [Laspinema sp. D1]|nr:S8 family serine peptidase [Laspinema sp. D2a]